MRRARRYLIRNDEEPAYALSLPLMKKAFESGDHNTSLAAFRSGRVEEPPFLSISRREYVGSPSPCFMHSTSIDRCRSGDQINWSREGQLKSNGVARLAQVASSKADAFGTTALIPAKRHKPIPKRL
jgi:hypothetical protein